MHSVMRTEFRKSLWNWRSDLPERVWIEEGGLFEQEADHHLQTAAMSWSVLAVNNVIELAEVHIGQILVEFFFPGLWFMDRAAGEIYQIA